MNNRRYETKRIAVEEHFSRIGRESVEKRLQDMDEAGVDMQVLSSFLIEEQHPDKAEAAAFASQMNEAFAKVVQQHPSRFSAFATISLLDPASAAKELERAVKQLGLKGTMVGSEINGEYMDNDKFAPFLEAAQALDVPIYLHPDIPGADLMKPFLPYNVLWSSMWGFTVSTGLHAMRLIVGGVFDKYPRLNIILGHLGEGIPFWLQRIDNRFEIEKNGWGAFKPDVIANKLKRKPSDYFRDNFYATTSGVFSQPALLCTYLELGAERIMFAEDYPAESAVKGVQFVEASPLPAADKEKIYHLNAEKLLRL